MQSEKSPQRKSDKPKEAAGLLGVFEALDATQAAFVEGKTSVWDYSNPEHFSALWEFVEDGSSNKASRVLIIWGNTPVDGSLVPVNTAEHLSPLHWAACVAKAAEIEAERKAKQREEERGKAKSREQDCVQDEVEGKAPQIQVCVLDLHPSAHRIEYLYEHYLCCEKSRLHWLRVFQAAHLFGSEDANGCFQPDAVAVATEALKGLLFPGLDSKRSSIGAGYFINRVRNELTSPHNAENRHAISNIIGPLILRSEWLRSVETAGVVFVKNGKSADFPAVVRGTPSHRGALNSILRASGLLCAEISEDKTTGQAEGEFTGWLALDSECADAGLNPRELRITVVDDQWQQGWLEWIKEGVGATPVELQVSADPDLLLRLLLDAGSEPRSFSVSLDVLQNERKGRKQDILLLDLRLFTNNPAGERECLITLKAVLTALSTSGRTNVDRQSTRQDLAVVSRRLEVLAGSAAELSSEDLARYVTVLARLLAQLDFSLPIIIFSSAGQRDVLKRFDTFPNIITDFSKPRHFQGADENVVAHAEDQLRQSMARAVKLLRGRKLVQQIQSYPLGLLEKARKRCAGYSHFELYFDESGKSAFPTFRCAALLVGYRGAGQTSSPDEDAKQVHRRIEKAGINLWDEENVRSQGNYSRDPSEQWEVVAPGLTEIFGERPLIPFVMSRTPSSTEECDDLDLAHPDALDNALFDLLELILEIALVEVLPAIHGDRSPLTVHIYGACRLQTLDLKATDKENAVAEAEKKWNLLKSCYGLQKDEVWETDEQWLRRRTKYENGKWCFLYRSLRADSFLPMLARCMGNRISSAFTDVLRPAILTVIGVQLPKRTRPTKEVRHQHYVCDRLAYFSKVSHQNPDSIDLGLLKNWPPFQKSSQGFLGRRNASLLRLVECGRQLDVENIPLAVGLGQALLGCEGIFPEAIASRLQGVIPKLSAESFSELCSLLDDISENSKASVLPADKFPGKQKTTSLRVQPAQRNEFREAKQQRTVPKARAHLKPSQLPASALRDLEEAMDRSIMPSQREAHSGDTHGVGATTHKRGEQADFQAIAQRLMHLAPPIVDSLRRLEGLGPVEIRETEPLVDLSEGSKLLIHPYYHDAGLPNAEKAIHVRTTVAERLRFAASQLPDEFCLIILDGWRSGALQRDVFIHVSQQAKGTPNLGKYVIDPDNPAAGVSYPTGAPPHRTGGAVDVTLGYVPSIWWPMGVGFDEMCPRAKTDVFEGADHDLEQRAAVVARFGRRLLVHVMASAGFSNYPEEIWHFDYGNSFWRHFGRIPGKGVYGCTGQ